MRRYLLAVVLVVAVGCSSGSKAATTTTTPSTTLPPRVVFRSDLQDRLTGMDATSLATITEAAASMCDLLGGIDAGITSDDARNDSAASDAAAIASLQESAIELLAVKFSSAVAKVVLTAAGADLCPAQSRPIDRYIADHL